MQSLDGYNVTSRLLPAEELAEVELRLASGRTQEYRVRPKLPLLIGYWTVEVDDRGRARYAPDIYQHDRRLLRALLGLRP